MSRSELSPAEYGDLKLTVYKRDKWQCRNPRCKRRNNLHAHHIIFRSQLGEDTTNNMVTICNECHDRVHDLVEGHGLKIVAKSGNPNDKPDANVGLKFISE